MVPRRPLESHFELFWVLVAEKLPESLWRLIFALFCKAGAPKTCILAHLGSSGSLGEN